MAKPLIACIFCATRTATRFFLARSVDNPGEQEYVGWCSECFPGARGLYQDNHGPHKFKEISKDEYLAALTHES
jgi:hypothetical protein